MPGYRVTVEGSGATRDFPDLEDARDEAEFHLAGGEATSLVNIDTGEKVDLSDFCPSCSDGLDVINAAGLGSMKERVEELFDIDRDLGMAKVLLSGNLPDPYQRGSIWVAQGVNTARSYLDYAVEDIDIISNYGRRLSSELGRDLACATRANIKEAADAIEAGIKKGNHQAVSFPVRPGTPPLLLSDIIAAIRKQEADWAKACELRFPGD